MLQHQSDDKGQVERLWLGKWDDVHQRKSRCEDFFYVKNKMCGMKSTWTHLPDSMQTLPQPVDHKDGWIRLPQGDTWGEKHPSIPKPCHHTRWRATLY